MRQFLKKAGKNLTVNKLEMTSANNWHNTAILTDAHHTGGCMNPLMILISPCRSSKTYQCKSCL